MGFLPWPTWISIPAELAALAADNTLKFTKAELRAPRDVAFEPGAGQCSYDVRITQGSVAYDNWLGWFPKIEDDRLWWPRDDEFHFGDLGDPEVYHANTSLEISLHSESAGIGDDTSGLVPVPIGEHIVEWRADTRYFPIWDLVIPGAMTAVMIGAEFKLADQFPKLKKLFEGKAGRLSSQRDDLLEVSSLNANPSRLAQKIDRLNQRIDLYQFLAKYNKELVGFGMDSLNFSGQESLGELIGERISEGVKTVSRSREQRLVVYDVDPPSISTSQPLVTLEATDIGGTTYSRYAQDLRDTVTASDDCGRPVTVFSDAPEVLPIGDTTISWTVRDAGPAVPDIDHDNDGVPDGQNFLSRTVTQTIRVEDTQAPLMVPPPGLVVESVVAENLGNLDLGQPLVADLADLNPEVASSTASPDGLVPVDTRTVVTWSATDTSGNSSTGEQLVTVKTPGSNTSPVAQSTSAETLTARNVDIVLNGSDADLLPYSDDLTGPGVADPLQFRIVRQPQHGEFVSPLKPFFIDDHRTDATGGLIDWINGQPDAAELMDDYILAVNTNTVWSFLDTNFCAVGADAPVDFVYEPLYVTVTDEGEQYFFDRYLRCDPNGTGSPPWDERQRISRWSADDEFLGHVRIDDNGGADIVGAEAVARIDGDGFAYFVDSRTGGEPVVSIQRCPADFSNTSIDPPYCQTQGFGPVDASDTSPYGQVPENALVDIDRELVYVVAGSVVSVFDYRREVPDDPASQRHSSLRITNLTDDQGSPNVLNQGCTAGGTGGFRNALEVDSAGNLYVTDRNCHRIHKFTRSYFDEEGIFVAGEYVGWMGRCETSNNLACENGHTKGFSCTAGAQCNAGPQQHGSGEGQFFTPVYLAADPNDLLYVADYDNRRIQRFGADGIFAGQAASTGDGINAGTEGGFVLGNMGPPKHVTVNSRNFFVVDQSENFVHIFDTSPFKDITDSSATVTYVSEFAFHSDTDDFTYSVNDGLVDSAAATVTIDVARNYRQPQPVGQVVNVDEDGSVVIVLSGTDPDGILDRDFNGLDSLTFDIVGAPRSGTLAPGGDTGDLTIDPGMEVWTYTPGRDFFGSDSLSFTVRDAFTDATSDGSTMIPETYGVADPATVTIDVASVNDIPIVTIQPPERVGAGFPILLRGTALDDFGTDYAATVFWGDGAVEYNGEILVDDSGTPTDASDDTAEITGVVFSTDGLTNIGRTPISASHTYIDTGTRTVRLCLKDAGLLENCAVTDLQVDQLVWIGADLDLSASEIIDGVEFAASIEVRNAEPLAPVTGQSAEQVTARLELPDALVLSSVASQQGSCTATGRVLDCDFGTLAPGEVARADLRLYGSGVLVYDQTYELTLETRTATPAVEGVILDQTAIKVRAVDLDRDGDGLPNIFEAVYGIQDVDADDDGDGLSNRTEFDEGTSPSNADTDGDGLSDGDELNLHRSDPLNADSDNDTLTDAHEVNALGTDPAAADSDGDGLPDDFELDAGLNPLVADSNGDPDADGLSDREEFEAETDRLDPDSDGDNLLDGDEVHVHGSDPTLADTDGDGLDDDAEVASGTRFDKPDTDDDGLPDGTEVFITATSPLISDTDRDGLPDGFETDHDRDPLLADYALAAGGLSTCALSDLGVECWGRNHLNQAPALVAGLFDPQLITMGYAHACAIDRNVLGVRSVVCWGDDTYGQSTPPADLVDPVQVAAGSYHTCALDRTGPLVLDLRCWGRDNQQQVSTAPTDLTRPLQVVSGISGNSSCVLDQTGSGPELVCWGEYNNGNSEVPTGLTEPGPLALGSGHGCIVSSGGRMCWGLDSDGQAPVGPVPSTAVQLSLGGFHSCALSPVDRNSYAVDCWGRNQDGQTSVPDILSAPLSLASGSHHSCALDDGNARCWGVETQFDYGQAPAERMLGIDPDGDTIVTALEIPGGSDPLDADTDRDGLSDSQENLLGTDPADADSDDDGLSDGQEVEIATNPLLEDSDGDGMLDRWEQRFALDPGNPDDAAEDADGDGVSNVAEHDLGSNPTRTDTDGDGLPDGAEIARFFYEHTGEDIGTAISEAVALADLDGDGDLDAAIANRLGSSRIRFNDGNAFFGSQPDYVLNDPSALDVAVADVDADGDPDVVLAHDLADEPNTLWLNDGGAEPEFVASGADLGAGATDGIQFGYLSHDTGLVDLFVANWGANLARRFDAGVVSTLTVSGSDGNSEDVAVGDLNGDGLDDALVVNRNQPNQVFRTYPPPGIPSQQVATFGAAEFSTAVALGDLNGDDLLDAYEVVFGGPDRIWLGDGNFGLLGGASLGSDGGNDVSLIDVNGDGQLDAVVANSGPNKVWLNDGSGNFTDSGVQLGSAVSFGVDSGDLNGDDLPDLFFANDGANSVWLLRRLDPTLADSDSDGADDGWELSHGLDPLNEADGPLDPDGDGLSNREEFEAGADPGRMDTDGDGMPDGWEVANALDPAVDDAEGDLDRDGLSNYEEYAGGSAAYGDDQPPVLTVPPDAMADSTGAFTDVPLGNATAVDARDGPVGASVDDLGPYAPGANTVTWTAVDLSGNVAAEDQGVAVTPRVDFDVNQTADEGNTVTVGLSLNGPAVRYPVRVGYVVSGSALNPDDHDAADGSLVINAGLTAELPVALVDDLIFEGEETVVLTMTTADNAVPGSQSTHTITITQGNQRPVVDIVARQNGRPVASASRNGGEIVISGEVRDPNTGDSHSFDWSVSDSGAYDPADSADQSYVLDPMSMAAGVYRVAVDVRDDGIPVESNRSWTLLQIVEEPPLLDATTDSDGDGIDDRTEGNGDADGDRIPDHLDDQDGLPTLPLSEEGFVLETQPGLTLRLGALAFESSGSHAEVDERMVAEESDRGYPNGVVDFEITGIEPGTTALVVVPLRHPLPANATYRKYRAAAWEGLVEDDRNAVWSASGQNGACPAPGSSSYVSGINPGDRCLQLELQDGGPNDSDASADGVIRDPGGVAVPVSVTLETVNIPDREVTAGSSDVVVLGFRLVSPSGDVELDGISLQASGDGDDTGIRRVVLLVDENDNGLRDPGERVIAEGDYDVDDGTLDLDAATPYLLPAGATNFVITYDF